MLVLTMMTLINRKKFHRVMYRAFVYVQARELTTQQTILQDQIEKLGDQYLNMRQWLYLVKNF